MVKTNDIHSQLKNEAQNSERSSKRSAVSPGFVHLHAQSAYSLLESAIPLQKIIDLAVADAQPALAVTDKNNLFGVLEFSEKAAAQGLQPIMGVKLSIDFADQTSGEDTGKKHLDDLPSLVLLAMNEVGYSNLVKLASIAHLGSDEDSDTSSEISQANAQASQLHGPHITLSNLDTYSEGIICLSGAGDGPINQQIHANNQQCSVARLQKLKTLFPTCFYVELQRHGSSEDLREQSIENTLLELAYDNNLPIVATNQPLFSSRDDYDAHDAMICIADGDVVASNDRKRQTPEHYFKSRQEMIDLFADLPEALNNTIEIAKRCSFRAQTHAPILPRFASEGDENPVEALKVEFALLQSQAKTGLEERLEEFEPAEGYTREDYKERLDFELGVIEQMGFPGYFLIVADFIMWSKNHHIPVGPGRGSGAGSLVAWALTITDLDPIRFSLLFERFLNPERISMPDFDIDFCQDRREEVIHYVQEKYGRDQVAQIITFGSLQARAVLRDVGRVLQMPYNQVDRIAKLVPANPANPVSLQQAIEMEPRLQEAKASEQIVSKLFDIATRLEGLYRHASTHAAGIVIGDRRLDELVPLYRDPRSDMPVTQFNMKWVEPAGLVKFDFLGLKTLTVLKTAVDLVSQRDDQTDKIDLLAIPLDDPNTYAMLTRGETVGVFQLESVGMRKALVGMKPDRFEDIIALVALYRPGPMENIPVYNARKNGEEDPEYIHPMIEQVLKETYGVIIYQEQVMQIAQIMAGYSLGDADILRRAMGKKIRSEMDKQRNVFVEGAQKNEITQSKANQIFDLLAKFADYGFNKSHAAAYALVSYQTAYMKANYPVEFLAASMQLDMGNTDKLAIFKQEASEQKIELVPPSVQTSGATFQVKENKIFYALSALKGVGEGAVSYLVDEREKNGLFKSISDFFSRIDTRQVNKRTIESLIFSGAFDCFGHSREQLFAGMERLSGHASRMQSDRETGQNDMFGSSGEESETVELPNVKPWMASEKLQKEFSAMGFYLSAHPLDEYRDLMEKTRVQLFSEFEQSVRAGATAGRLAGTVTSCQERKTRTGKSMGIIMLSDPTGQYEAVIFEESLMQFRELLRPGNSIIMLVGAEMREEGVSVRIQHVESLEAEAARETRNLRVFMRDEEPVGSLSELFSGKSAPARGNGRVSFVVVQDSGAMEVEMMLPNKFNMTPQIANAVKGVPGVLDVELV